MGLLLFEGQAVEQPRQLSARNARCGCLGRLGPAEASAFQTAIIEPEAVMIPHQDLEFIAATVTEDKEAAAEQIQLKDLADQGGQTVDGFSQIGVAAGQVDAGAFSQAQ